MCHTTNHIVSAVRQRAGYDPLNSTAGSKATSLHDMAAGAAAGGWWVRRRVGHGGILPLGSRARDHDAARSTGGNGSMRGIDARWLAPGPNRFAATSRCRPTGSRPKTSDTQPTPHAPRQRALLQQLTTRKGAPKATLRQNLIIHSIRNP